MGKKGARRKTRWRTLSIGTPPGEEDEEEGVRSNGYAGESQAREAGGYQHQRNGLPGPPWLKSRHGSAGSSASGNGNGSTTSGYGSGYASGGSRSRRGPDDSADSPTQQQKLVFNEDEYTRITTPRQDMLFKKGYLSQRKLWHATSTASMSATPSTTESQSASHSTADGSEAAEDQQLLDSGGSGEYVAAPALVAVPAAVAAPPPPQLGFGTYYDHASGYYYEYPMMLVGPALPEPLGPNILAAMPCAPVPLRPIEWVNPAFVPKLASQQYCYMDCQAAQGTDCAALVDAQGMPVPVAEPLAVAAMNGLSHEASLEGSASASASVSASGSVADEPLAMPAEQLLLQGPMLEGLQEPEPQEVMLPMEEGEAELEEAQPEDELELELGEEEEEAGLMEYPEPTAFVETLPAAGHQPLHLAHMIAQPLGQPYLYPGQYMFGPPVVNVNDVSIAVAERDSPIMPGFSVPDEGVTMQSGPILRCSDMVANTAAAAAACAKRRKKKKKRKQKRPHALGNTEDEDEEDYSSEGENGLVSSRVCWSVAATPAVASFSSNRPLNPECQEFHLRPASSTITVVDAASAASAVDPLDVAAYYATASTPTNGKALSDNGVDVGEEEDGGPGPLLNHHVNNNEPLRLTDGEAAESPDDSEEQLATGKNLGETATMTSNGLMTNGDSTIVDESATIGATDPSELLLERNNSSNANGNGNLPRRKYSAKSLKFAREPTPGPDLDGSSVALVVASSEGPLLVANANETETDLEEVTAMMAATGVAEKPAAQKDGDLDICQTWVNESSITSESCCNENNAITATTATATTSLRTAQPTATDEDSGFESQSKLGSSSSRPITAAVTEWLKCANSPNLFIMSSATSEDDDDGEDEDDDDVSVCNEPSKNLQGNPMPALSVNAGAEDGCQASRGEFAKPADRASTRVCEDVQEMKAESFHDAPAKRTRKSRSAKRKVAKDRKKNGQGLASLDSERENVQALARASTQNSVGQSDTPVDRKIEAICEFTGKDSDAGMRVAENSRITISPITSTTPITTITTTATTTKTTTKARKTASAPEGAGKSSEDARLRKVRESSCKSTIDELQSVKTFEKGEIVVSMDGELLRVAAAEDRTTDSCGSTVPEEEGEEEPEHEPSLGSIDEPDVLECWEAETLEPLATPKKLATEGELTEEVEALEHVQRYYRLQASVTSVEDEVCSEPRREENEKSPLSTPTNESTCSEEIVEVRLAVPEVWGKSCEHLDPRLPVDEAFEVYESCYTGRPTLPFGPGIDKSTRLLGRRSDEDGPIPCRAVCCNIQ